MFGIKEYFDYVDKRNGKVKDSIKELEKQMSELSGADAVAECRAKIAEAKSQLFKPIFENACLSHVEQDSFRCRARSVRFARVLLLGQGRKGRRGQRGDIESSACCFRKAYNVR